MTTNYHPPFVEQPGPAADSYQITPSDSVQLPTRIRGFYVGVTGDVTVVTAGGNTVLFKAIPAGKIMPVQALYVKATGTTATNLVGLV